MSEGRVISKDGTPIAYDRRGRGPAVLLVGGSLADREENAPLATALAEHFTVFNYDRRGRGRSGDTQPYAPAREIEDLEALVVEAGGSAHVYGVSSGGALALEAAAAGVAIGRLALYEVPYDTAPETAGQTREYVEALEVLLAQDRRDEALELFMRMAGSADEDIAAARSSPMWPGLLRLAPTLAYDAACLGERQPPVARLATLSQPTFVATGGTIDAFERAADAIAGAVPQAERHVIEGQGHVVDPLALAPLLERFFGARVP